jgi:folylpolyglutamate synthase/dihydropteroate synthase
MGAVGSRRDVALVFGALQKKSWRAMLARLDHTASNHVFTPPPVSGAVDPNEMAAIYGGEVILDLREALARARAMVGPRGLVVVTGSTFLVGPARSVLLGLESDPPVDL